MMILINTLKHILGLILRNEKKLQVKVNNNIFLYQQVLSDMPVNMLIDLNYT